MSREFVEYFPFVGTDQTETLGEARTPLQGGGDDRGREWSAKTCSEGVVKVTTTATALLTTIVSTYRIQKLDITFLVDPASTVQPVERNLGGYAKATRNVTVGLHGSRRTESLHHLIRQQYKRSDPIAPCLLISSAELAVAARQCAVAEQQVCKP